MLKIITPTAMLLPLTLLSSCKHLWTNIMLYSLLITTVSLQWLTPTY